LDEDLAAAPAAAHWNSVMVFVLRNDQYVP
jgi:hypothetical protein